MPCSDSLVFSRSDRFFQVGRSADEFLVVHQDVVVRVFLSSFFPVGFFKLRYY